MLLARLFTRVVDVSSELDDAIQYYKSRPLMTLKSVEIVVAY
jgi:hypothetical protein